MDLPLTWLAGLAYSCWLGEIKEPGLVESGLEDEING